MNNFVPGYGEVEILSETLCKFTILNCLAVFSRINLHQFAFPFSGTGSRTLPSSTDSRPFVFIFGNLTGTLVWCKFHGMLLNSCGAEHHCLIPDFTKISLVFDCYACYHH